MRRRIALATSCLMVCSGVPPRSSRRQEAPRTVVITVGPRRVRRRGRGTGLPRARRGSSIRQAGRQARSRACSSR